MSLLLFQNIGFLYSRYVIAVVGLLWAFCVGINKHTLKLIFNKILILTFFKAFIVLAYWPSAQTAILRDIVVTSAYEIIALLVYFSLQEKKYLKNADLVFSIFLIGGGAAILIYSSHFVSNYLVREIGISGNDNRFASILNLIVLFYLLRGGNKWVFLSLCTLLVYAFSVINARGAQVVIFLTVFLAFAPSFRPQSKILLSIAIFAVFNAMYFIAISYGTDTSSIARLEWANYVISGKFYEHGVIEPHFVTLSFFQVFHILSFVLFIGLFLFFHPYAVLFVLVNFSFSSEFFVQIWLLSLFILSDLFHGSPKKMAGT